MPLYEHRCRDCGEVTECLILGPDDVARCQACQSENVDRLLSAQSSLSGVTYSRIPGPGDTGCCGTSPADAGCAGPGSCCGKR